MKYTALALSAFLFVTIIQDTSCTRVNKYLKETQMLDSMQVFLAKADSTVKTIDSAQITRYASHIEKDDQLLQFAHTDSVSPGATDILRSFNQVRWSLLTIAGRKGPLLKEIEKSQQQMKHLSHDLKHNLVSPDSAGYYVAFETKRASELIQVSDMSAEEVREQVPMYTILAPKADSLISLLQNHKKF